MLLLIQGVAMVPAETLECTPLISDDQLVLRAKDIGLV